MDTLKDDDLLIITADHGNDPTYTGTDHTREKVPFLAWSPSMNGSGELPETDTFAVIGATVADNFGVRCRKGRSARRCWISWHDIDDDNYKGLPWAALILFC